MMPLTINEKELDETLFNVIKAMILLGIEPRMSWSKNDEVIIETGLGSDWDEDIGDYVFRPATEDELGNK